MIGENHDPFTLKIERGFTHHLRDAIAGPFSWIASVEVIEQAGSPWPRGLETERWFDGAGPYRLCEHRPGQTTLVRSQHWWATQPPPDRWRTARLARLEAINFFAGSPDKLMQMYALGDIDMAGWPLDDPQIDALAQQFPEHQIYNLPGRRALQLVTPRDPDPDGALSDPRVAMAINWSVDRAQLERSVAAPVRLRPSGPVAPHFTELALPDDELREHLGYQDSNAAARATVADIVGSAGGAEQIAPLKLVVADEVAGVFPELAEMILSMLRQSTGLRIGLEYAGQSETLDRLMGGERFALLRWGETPKSPLPTRTWQCTLHTEGAGNWGAFSDPDLDLLLDRFQSELDPVGLTVAAGAVQRQLLSGSSTGWIHELAVPVQRAIVQPWFRPDARLLDFAWSDHHLADCGIQIRGDSAYPADRRPLPDSDSDASESRSVNPCECLSIDQPRPQSPRVELGNQSTPAPASVSLANGVLTGSKRIGRG